MVLRLIFNAATLIRRWLTRHCDNSVTYTCDSCWIDDDDLDGIDAGINNCPTIANADQAECNAKGIGDVCEIDEMCFPISVSNGAFAAVCL